MRPRLSPHFFQGPIAHRGLHDLAQNRPENSMSAILAAISAGYGVEFDVQLTRDGQAVMFHDATLDRMSDKSGPVADHTLAQLNEIALLGTSDHIPALDDVVTLLRANDCPALIEIKPQPSPERTHALACAVAKTIGANTGTLSVMSFDPASMTQMQKIAPHIPRGLVAQHFTPQEAQEEFGLEDAVPLSNLALFEEVGASFASYRWQDLPHPAFAELRKNGWPVFCWTIKSAQEAQKVDEFVDNITFENYLP